MCTERSKKVWEQKWPNMASLPLSQMVNRQYTWLFGTILSLFTQFWIFLDPNKYFASRTQTAYCPKCVGAKNQVLSEMVQKSPNGPKMVPNAPKNKNMLHSSFRTIWTTFGYWQVFHVWPFLIRKGPFWTPPCTWLKNGNGCPGQLKRAERG